jgi:predicted HTH transcriptional regulator
LISEGESLTVELKRELGDSRPRDICNEVAALATMQGGHLFVGVDDGGSVAGVPDPQAVISRIEHWIGAWVAPAPRISAGALSLRDLTVVNVRVVEGTAPLYITTAAPIRGLDGIRR